MALADLPGVGTFQASKPVIAQPMDLQPAIEKMMNAYEEGFISADDLQKRATIGTSDAEAARAQNEAKQATAEQDVIDQRGQAAPKTPTLDKATKGNFNPQHWSTEELGRLAGEAGYVLLPGSKSETKRPAVTPSGETQESIDFWKNADTETRARYGLQ